MPATAKPPVAVDTNIFIYWLDDTSEFHTVATALCERLFSGAYTVCCSTLVLTEILARPGASVEALQRLPIAWQDCTPAVAIQAGKLRQVHGFLRTPDAVHVASALASSATVLYSNDSQLLRLDAVLKVVGLGPERG